MVLMNLELTRNSGANTKRFLDNHLDVTTKKKEGKKGGKKERKKKERKEEKKKRRSLIQKSCRKNNLNSNLSLYSSS